MGTSFGTGRNRNGEPGVVRVEVHVPAGLASDALTGPTKGTAYQDRQAAADNPRMSPSPRKRRILNSYALFSRARFSRLACQFGLAEKLILYISLLIVIGAEWR
jgi:hypothetical protein